MTRPRRDTATATGRRLAARQLSSASSVALCVGFALAVALTTTTGCRPKSRSSEQVNVIGSTTVLPIAQAAAEEFNRERPGVEVLVQGGGSSAGIEAVTTGRALIGTSSRDLKDEEALGLKDIPVAVDVIAVIVNPKNRVRGLSLAQLKGIFRGRITDWGEVGGPEGRISVVNRDEASGTREAFSKLALDKEPFDTHAAVLPGTGQVRDVVSRSRDAIGYISFGYVTDEVKVLSIDGVAPTIEDIRLKRYKLHRLLHFLTKGEPQGTAKDFIEYVLSDDVQERIVGAEFIPVRAVDE